MGDRPVDVQWFVLDVNPTPWAVGPLSVIRKNGKMIPTYGRNQELHAYKEAVKEQMLKTDARMIEGKVGLLLWFWRSRPAYETSQARTARKHEADATNMQKATEDALQGILYKNDKDNYLVQSTIVEQGEDVVGKVVICAYPIGDEYPKFPDGVQAQIDELNNRYPLVDNEWNNEGPIPF